jgi:HK97 gp10 family phage protein
MPKITIKMDKNIGFNEAIQKAIEKKLDAALNDIADFIGTQSDANLRDEDGAFDTGFLANSLVVDKDEFLHKEIGYGALYAGYIEFGSSPHFPPISAIYSWLWRKKTDLKLTYRKDKTTMFNGKSHNTDVLRIAWSIAQNMAAKGVEPKPFMRPAFNEGKSKAGQFIKKRMSK